MQREAAIDTDFIMHLVEIKELSTEEHIELVQLMFAELDVTPIMHELVYEKELKGGADTNNRAVAMSFFDKELIACKLLSQIADTPSKRMYYKMVFEEIYRDFIGDLPEGVKDILKDWKTHASFGETHTVVMCFMINSAIFLSDDKGSKTLANIIKRKRSFELTVYNRKEACDRIKELGSTKINKRKRKMLSHQITS